VGLPRQAGRNFMTSSVGLTAREVMVAGIKTMSPDQRVLDAVQLLLKHRFSGVPIVDEEKNLIGMLTEKDCIQALLRAVEENIPPLCIRDVMTTENLITITEDTHLLTMAHLFLTNPVRRLPVLRDGRLVGQVSRRDLLRAAMAIFEGAPDREAAILYLSAIEAEPPI